MVNPPKKIKVGPHVYSVIRASKKDMGEDCYGSCDCNELTIRLRSRVKHSKLREVLIHEVLHAAHFLSGRGGEDTMTAEHWVDITDATLLGILRDNPELVGYLVGE